MKQPNLNNAQHEVPPLVSVLVLLKSLQFGTNRYVFLARGLNVAPFKDASGNLSTDITGFAEVLDYVVIMNYDVWGYWDSTMGPNTPLNDTCALPVNQQGSAVPAVKGRAT